MSNREAFLEATKAARNARHAEKARECAALKIQAAIRGWLSRIQTVRGWCSRIDKFIAKEDNSKTPAKELYILTRSFLLMRKKSCEITIVDLERLEGLCRCITDSLDKESIKLSYIGLSLNKTEAIGWINHMKNLLEFVVNCMDPKISPIKLSTSKGSKTLSGLLRTLLSFTSVNGWKILKLKAFCPLLPGMQQLCSNILGHLVNQDLFPRLKSLLLNGLSGPSGLVLKKTSLAAILTIACRPVVAGKYSDNLVSMFLLHILSVPALVRHAEDLSPNEVISGILLNPEHDLGWRCINLLSENEQQLKSHFTTLEGSYALCLTANLIHLTSLYAKLEEESGTVNENHVSGNAVMVLAKLLESCGEYVTAKQSNLSHWHPVLGWFSVVLDSYLQDSMTLVRDQLTRLWSLSCVKYFFKPLRDIVKKLPDLGQPPSPVFTAVGAPPQALLEEEQQAPMAAAKSFLKKAVEKTRNTTNAVISSGTSRSEISSSSTFKLGSPTVIEISLVCSMYQAALKTLSQLKLEILAGLCQQDVLLPPMWRFLQSLGPNCGLKSFQDSLAMNPKGTAPEFQLLTLFADCLSYLLAILDDVEMYEKQVPFALGHYITISKFLNLFIFRSIWPNFILDAKSPLFQSLHGLLMVLYRRDNRRQFTKPGHWLLQKEVRSSSLILEMEKGRKWALFAMRKIPHILPHADRVIIFRFKVSSDKESLGLSQDSLDNVIHGNSTLVTIHRGRIVEDGYRQLSNLSPNALKGVIRVKFVNIQGLDEAGIDQDGVFKEFLEETLKKVFDPGLNLFCATSDERLYPSPLSHLTDNHLALFEFVGKMIGKAVYEGIVVDVPFASFFVSQVLGQDQNTAYYSYIDELPSLDTELSKNLTYVKYYEGDASDLDLTFSYDQDVMGQVVTHELVHGGKGIMVTNENRISYMHAVAQFRMHTQIKDQIAAFTRGFRCIISPEWLNLFSPPEVMRLISGDNAPLDLKDLRKNTNYYGGFHDSHRVITWLWDILEKDFSQKERAAFLRFVTSCSKPPLLGFEHLEPSFSIRCVEVGEDDDDGDTVGSVLRGFLALRKKDPVNRLPTASTCFNLLKLPNYQKKSTLREKLRYAVMSNTGFELS